MTVLAKSDRGLANDDMKREMLTTDLECTKIRSRSLGQTGWARRDRIPFRVLLERSKVCCFGWLELPACWVDRNSRLIFASEVVMIVRETVPYLEMEEAVPTYSVH
jgi:hypothetical protein